MRTIQIIVDYNTTLFNFVDSLSKWDTFVSSHIYDYFNQNYNLDERDEKLLLEYAQKRKPLSWEGQEGLYKWAHDSFPSNSEYSTFLPIFKHFEAKLSHEGRTLQAELLLATKQLESMRIHIEHRLEELSVNQTISGFFELFNTAYKSGVLPCYLVHSPNENYQGGANGEMIFIQSASGLAYDQDKLIDRAAKLIIHEYTHKELEPGKYYALHSDPNLRDFYRKIYDKVWPEYLYGLVEEAVVHSVCDVLIWGKDPNKIKSFYHERYKDEPELQRRNDNMYQSIIDISVILQRFQERELTIAETREKIDQYFMKFVADRK